MPRRNYQKSNSHPQTLLPKATLPLIKSSSYIFNAFLKIFTLVVAFGLLHGLVLLPVVLSLVGKAPAKVGTEEVREREEKPKKRPKKQPKNGQRMVKKAK